MKEIKINNEVMFPGAKTIKKMKEEVKVMANEKNLKPGEHKLSVEEAKKGGINSGKARRAKKTMKEQLNLLLSLSIKNEKTKDQLKSLGIEEDDMNNQMALIIAQYQKALKGDTQAFNTLRDTSGQQVANKLEIDKVPIIMDDIEEK